MCLLYAGSAPHTPCSTGEKGAHHSIDVFFVGSLKVRILKMHPMKLFSLSYMFDKPIDDDVLIDLKIPRI
jgi:hypothetical protein